MKILYFIFAYFCIQTLFLSTNAQNKSTVSRENGNNTQATVDLKATVAEKAEGDEQSSTVDVIANKNNFNSTVGGVVAAFQKENSINAVTKENGIGHNIDLNANSQIDASAPPRYRLHYFDFRGRGEPIRLIFHYAGEPFEDFRIASEQWKSHYKNDTPYGHVPILVDQKNGGRVLAESYAISRYLARKFGMTGGRPRGAARGRSNVEEAAEEEPIDDGDEVLWAEAKVDEFADFHKDVAADFHPLTASDEEKTADEQVAAAALAAKYFPLYVRQLETADAAVVGRANESAGGFLFSGLSATEREFGARETVTWVDLMVADFFETISAAYPRVFARFERLNAFRQRVNAIPQIAAYLARRKPDV